MKISEFAKEEAIILFLNYLGSSSIGTDEYVPLTIIQEFFSGVNPISSTRSIELKEVSKTFKNAI